MDEKRTTENPVKEEQENQSGTESENTVRKKKISLKAIIICCVSVIAAAAVITGGVLYIMSLTPEGVSKSILKLTFAYKTSDCGYLDIENPSEKLSAMKSGIDGRYPAKKVTDEFLTQLKATTLPEKFAGIAHDSGRNTACKKIVLEDITPEGEQDSAIYNYTVTLKCGDKKYEVTGTVMLADNGSGWQVSYLIVQDTVSSEWDS